VAKSQFFSLFACVPKSITRVGEIRSLLPTRGRNIYRILITYFYFKIGRIYKERTEMRRKSANPQRAVNAKTIVVVSSSREMREEEEEEEKLVLCVKIPNEETEENQKI